MQEQQNYQRKTEHKSFGAILTYALPIFLVLSSTIIKLYAFSDIHYYGFKIPVILYMLSAIVSWLFAGKRSAIVAIIVAILISLVIIAYPQLFNSIPANPYSIITLYSLAGLLMLLLIKIHLNNIALQDEKEEYFRFLADAVPDKFWTGDSSGLANYYNKEWFDYTGYNDVDELKNKVWQLIHPDEIEQIKAVFEKNITSGTSYEIEHRIRNKNGQFRWHLSRTRPLKDSKGKVKLWVGSCTDIHDRKVGEDMLKESEQYLRHLANNTPVIIWQTDKNGKLNFISKQWEAFSGINTENSLESNWKENLHPDDVAMQENTFRNCLENQRYYQAKFRLKRKDGVYRWFLSMGQPLFENEFKGYLGSLTDITEQEEIQQQSSNLLKKMDEFMSIASHELKTPVTTIRGYLQIMQKEAEKNNHPQYLTFLQKANSQQLKLSRLIQDLLDGSKIQEGKVKLNYTTFPVKILISDCLSSFQNNYSQHKVTVEGDTEEEITADAFRIEQVLTNILFNAAKYSPDSYDIIIKVSATSDEVIVSVTDFGIGIPAKNHRFIFGRFYRVEDSSFKFSGLGVGLYICREIIKEHKGRIWFKSVEGKGSVFSFAIPSKEKLTLFESKDI